MGKGPLYTSFESRRSKTAPSSKARSDGKVRAGFALLSRTPTYHMCPKDFDFPLFHPTHSPDAVGNALGEPPRPVAYPMPLPHMV